MLNHTEPHHTCGSVGIDGYGWTLSERKLFPWAVLVIFGYLVARDWGGFVSYPGGRVPIGKRSWVPGGMGNSGRMLALSL